MERSDKQSIVCHCWIQKWSKQEETSRDGEGYAWQLSRTIAWLLETLNLHWINSTLGFVVLLKNCPFIIERSTINMKNENKSFNALVQCVLIMITIPQMIDSDLCIGQQLSLRKMSGIDRNHQHL